MSAKTKKHLVIAWFSIVHLVSTAFFSFWVLGFILARHHDQLSPATAAKESFVRGALSFFEFPLIPLSRVIFGQAAVGQTMLLWLPNSVLWAIVVYYSGARFNHIRRQQV